MNFYSDNESLKFYLNHPEMKKAVTLKEMNFADHGKYADAPANAEEGLEHYDLVMDLVGEISGNVLAPNAESVDQEGPHIENNEVVYAKGTTANHEALRDAGLYGMTLPRQYDGLNLGYVPNVMAAEIISRADAGFANIWGLQECAETVNEFACDELKAKFLSRIRKGDTCSMDLTEPDAGSDLQAVRLKATWDEASNCWRLNGVKRFITNGGAQLHLVLARSEEGTTDGRGLSYFLYDKADGGLTVRRLENKMGIHGSPTAELVFKNAPAQIVGDRKLGLIKYVMALMNGARLGVAAQSVGLAEAAYREAKLYASQREQFGKTIDQFPLVQDLLRDMRTKTDASRSLLYETARKVDITKSYEAIMKTRSLTPEERKDMKENSRIADALTPMVKLMAAEWANQTAYDSIQVHGGSGFMREYACERLYRDARILTIYEGTSQLQVVAAVKGIAGGTYLKCIEDYDAQVEAALVAGVENAEEIKKLRAQLQKMIEDYKALEAAAKQMEVCPDRRLTESLAYIVMGYLLLLDSTRCGCFLESCKNLIVMGRGEIAKHSACVMQ